MDSLIIHNTVRERLLHIVSFALKEKQIRGHP